MTTIVKFVFTPPPPLNPKCWGHSRSRASRFYFKIKTRGFHMKTLCIVYGVPLGPFATSSLAFLFKLTNARLSHENSKPVWNLLVLKNAIEARECESATAKEKSRSLALALSRSRASRFLKGLNFRHVWSFHVKVSRKKARLEIANGPNGTPYTCLHVILNVLNS